MWPSKSCFVLVIILISDNPTVCYLLLVYTYESQDGSTRVRMVLREQGWLTPCIHHAICNVGAILNIWILNQCRLYNSHLSYLSYARHKVTCHCCWHSWSINDLIFQQKFGGKQNRFVDYFFRCQSQRLTLLWSHTYKQTLLRAYLLRSMIQLLAAVFYRLVIQTASTIRFSRRFNFAIFDPWNETKSDYGSLKINPFAKACSDQDYLGIAKHTRQFHIFIAIYFRLDLGLARLLANHIHSLSGSRWDGLHFLTV